jgi:hypothetical protein
VIRFSCPGLAPTPALAEPTQFGLARTLQSLVGGRAVSIHRRRCKEGVFGLVARSLARDTRIPFFNKLSLAPQAHTRTDLQAFAIATRLQLMTHKNKNHRRQRVDKRRQHLMSVLSSNRRRRRLSAFVEIDGSAGACALEDAANRSYHR